MAEITGAAHPLVLGGEEFHLSPLSDRDIEELNYWLQDQVIQVAVRSMSSVTDQRVRDELMDAAVRQASGLTFLSGEGAKRMRSLEGVSRVTWQGLRRRHPQLTYERVKELILDPKTIKYVNEVFRKLNHGKAGEVKAPRDGAPQEEGKAAEQGDRVQPAHGEVSRADA